MMFRRGQLIHGKKTNYQIVRLIHVGGIAATYLARVTNEDRWLAVKIPAQDQDASVESRHRNRVKREGVVLRMVDHPNIVKLIEELELTGTPILIEEYVLGGRMLETFKSKPANLHEALEIMCPLVGAVCLLHQRTIIHRDICPKNIIMEPDRGPVLVDFNISLFVHEKCNRAGTEFWSAPEHIDSAFHSFGASFKSDVYSLGAVFLFLLTGREPDRYYRSDRDISSLRSELRSIRIPIGIADCICRSLSFNPELRPPVEEIRKVLCVKAPKELAAPAIDIDGKMFDLDSLTEIGREHRCVDCRGKRMVYVKDPVPFVERHHIRLKNTTDGDVEMFVLPGKNTVALSRDGGRVFHAVRRDMGIRLENGDIVALAYSKERGSYKTFRLRR